MGQPLKVYLSDEHLEFALAHVSNFYDTDFFPRTEEFLAIKHYWSEVKDYLLNNDLDTIVQASPLVEAWPKVRGGFRVVHRLEPLDALIYTALAKKVLLEIEESRMSPEIACSYRFSNSHDSFFGNGSGFEMFRGRCEILAEGYPFVLCTDITDFYNKIYLHRLQGAIELAAPAHPDISKHIEYFLGKLNTKTSQGIPVGPAASIVMSEVTLNDVDKFLHNHGVEFVRYVDDFRIFGNSQAQLTQLLQSLTLYLHESHRLTLNTGKTFISDSQEFLKNELHNQYAQDKLQIFDDLDNFDPYSLPDFADSTPTEDSDNSSAVAEALSASFSKLLSFETIDLGLARAIIRRAKAHKVDSLVDLVVQNVEFLAPAFNDVVLYLDSLSSPEFLSQKADLLVSMCASSATELRAVRIWLEWYLAKHADLLSRPIARIFVMGSERLRPQAQAATTLKNEAWIKERKSKLLHYAGWDRRSIILASALLSTDEREKWLRHVVKEGHVEKLDVWVARWVLEGSPVIVEDDFPW